MHLLSGVEEESLAYGFCLSVKRDMLSQWRGYADDGMGFAIGFKKEAIEAVFAPAGANRVSSGEAGHVKDRGKDTASKNRYLVRYLATDGTQAEDWWTEDDIRS